MIATLQFVIDGSFHELLQSFPLQHGRRLDLDFNILLFRSQMMARSARPSNGAPHRSGHRPVVVDSELHRYRYILWVTLPHCTSVL
jgi:hypothetical protein